MSVEQIGQQVIEFVRVHESWAAPVVFALAFAESLAFLSLILPSWAALVAIGALMGASAIDFVTVWISGALGAAFGDWLSYWIGAKFKDSIADTWPFSHHPHLLLRGEAFIKNWGAAGNLCRAVLGTLASIGPHRRWYLVHALLAIPACKFQFRVCMGGGPAEAGRHRCHDFQLVMELCIELDVRRRSGFSAIPERTPPAGELRIHARHRSRCHTIGPASWLD